MNNVFPSRTNSRASENLRFCLVVLLAAAFFLATRGYSLGAPQGVDALAPIDRGQNAQNDRNDPFQRDKDGVQRRYPSVVKIVGRAETKTKDDGTSTIPFFYGTGCYVSEFLSWGIILTNWHVVSESTESLEAIFPGREPADCRVILRDEHWDLAALIVAKPENVKPLPIALELFTIGDTLWVGGYGQTGGLDDFRLISGKLNTYVSLVDPDECEKDKDSPAGKNAPKPEPLYETYSIGCGVRHGDSGGPIFNKYGELAGLLWGSDTKSTMGTPGPRLQIFLSQATVQAAKLRSLCFVDQKDPDDFSSWAFFNVDCSEEAEGSRKRFPDVLPHYQSYPISSAEIYESPNGTLTAEELLKVSYDVAKKTVEKEANDLLVKEKTPLPPSRPIFSLSFVKQQRVLKTARPENDKSELISLLYENWKKKTLNTRNERLLATKGGETLFEEQESTIDDLSDDEGARFREENDNSRGRLVETSAPAGLKIGSARTSNADEEDRSETLQAYDGPEDDGDSEIYKEKDVKIGKRFSDFQVYVVACVLFAFFFFSASLINSREYEQKEKTAQPRKKPRLR